MIVFGCIISVLIIMAAYHHVRLALDKPTIKPAGELVEVDGCRMHIYAEGVGKTGGGPTLVLLAGSGVAAPVYDYKVLYSRLSGDYRVVVAEKFGYGYSDVCGAPRDVETMVEEIREALAKAGEAAPYVLMPHSMSALEAIYWAHTYPEEVQAVVGLDMAVPASYDKNRLSGITLMRIGVFLGLHRLEIFNPVSRRGVTKEEYRQNKLLNDRNTLNADVYNECRAVLKNARRVSGMNIADVPMLMFTTNLGDSGRSKAWEAAQEGFAAKMSRCVQIKYHCGHNLHYYKSEEMAAAILDFLGSLRG